MDNLQELLAFVRAAEQHGFVPAGRQLGVSPSAVGKSIARLEHKLGVRLFHRSTRRISLTAEGELFLARCQRLLEDLADAQQEVSNFARAPRGKLRVSLPVVGYRMLLPVLPDFVARYPDIELDLDFSDRLVDAVDEGFDAVVRSGELIDSRLRTRALGPFRLVLVAAPAYLAAHGTPGSPDELAGHACLRYRFASTGKLQEWALQAPGGEAVALPPLRTAMTSNNIESLICAAGQGLGIAFLPDFAVRESLAEGRLRTVLDGHTLGEGRFSVLWPASRHLSPRLRAWIDFLAERLFPAAAARAGNASAHAESQAAAFSSV
jgi:DNA-binding transcriptional LysR family regulator